jgi:hypothetical protein
MCDHVVVIDRASIALKDFAHCVSRGPGAFHSLGVRNVLFDVDEQCMGYGTALQVMNALAILRGPAAD